MPTDRTHYEVLGLARDASAEDVKKAYRRMAQLSHPDVGGSAALFGMVGEANRVLSNALLRREYDQTLSAPPRPEPRPEPEPVPEPAPEPPRSRRTTASGGRSARPTGPRTPAAGAPRDVDDALDALGLASFLRALSVAAVVAAAGVLLRITGTAAAVLGVGVGELTPLGRYHPVPAGVPWRDAWPLLAVVAVGLLVAAVNGWQRRVLRGRVHPVEAVLVALWLALVLAAGELLVVRPAAGAAAAVTAGGYAAYVAVRTRGGRRPRGGQHRVRRPVGAGRWPRTRFARSTPGR